MNLVTRRVFALAGGMLLGTSTAVDAQVADRNQRAQAPGEGVWRNYDFVPGDTVWTATNFSGEPIGRFPASQLVFVSGNLQLVALNGDTVLEASSTSTFRVKLPRTLPQRFTVEFVAQIAAANQSITLLTGPPSATMSRYVGDYVQVNARPGVYRRGSAVSTVNLPRLAGTMVPVKLQVDSSYAILYVGTERAAQVPTAEFGRTSEIEFRLTANARLRTYIKDIVVAVGLNKLYDALNTTGTFITRGLLFDFGSDRLRPESTPTLEMIRRTLAEHPDLRIEIVGHTDDRGEAAYNQQLSERRANSVVSYLRANGIAADRLRARGGGEAEPMAPNTSETGRTQNRRVELKVLK